MKYYISVFILVSVFSFTYAQDSSKSCPAAKHGLQFQIGSLLYLSNFDNYTFSYRYRPDENYGFRLGLLTSYFKDDYDITEQVDSAVSKPPNYYHSYDFKVSIEYLHSLVSYKSFSLILGGGPFISFSKDERTDTYTNPTYISEYIYNEKSTGFGLDIVLGAEYALTDNIIISSEYTFSVLKNNIDIDNSEKNTYPNNPEKNSFHSEKGKRNDFSFGGNYVNFGLAVFF